jgi:hypothetical protein
LDDITFPTLGEIVKYLFNTAGFNARSRGVNSIFKTEKNKKSFLTSLGRLSKETSELSKNLEYTLDIFLQFLEFEAPKEKVILAIAHGIDDIFIQYRDLIRNEGTYLNKGDTTKWLIKSRLISRLSRSQKKLYYKYNLSDEDLIFPESNLWFLPSQDDKGVIEWPLNKVFQWIYQITDTSQTRFHYPEKSTRTDDYRLNQNLENVFRWGKGKSCRSWSELKQNFIDSFDALEICSNPKYQRSINQKTREHIIFVLFIARFTTNVCRDIKSEFGDKYLFECVSLYRRRIADLDIEHKPLKEVGSNYIKHHNITDQDEINALWYELTDSFWRDRTNLYQEFAKNIQPYTEQHYLEFGAETPFPEEIKHRWIKAVGAYIVNDMVDSLTCSAEFKPTSEFIRLYSEGAELRKNPSISLEKADKYQNEVIASGLINELSWLIAWITASYYYRAGNHQEAHQYYCDSFNQGKYTVGRDGYKLFNQYIESCAKMKKWHKFKKGVAWATYLGIKVRWIRDSPESRETLEDAYDILGRANYPIL